MDSVHWKVGGVGRGVEGCWAAQCWARSPERVPAMRCSRQLIRSVSRWAAGMAAVNCHPKNPPTAMTRRILM
jgi:hypothetical protein